LSITIQAKSAFLYVFQTDIWHTSCVFWLDSLTDQVGNFAKGYGVTAHTPIPPDLPGRHDMAELGSQSSVSMPFQSFTPF
jgi:hypothetical protein